MDRTCLIYYSIRNFLTGWSGPGIFTDNLSNRYSYCQILRNIMINDNSICMLFERHAKIGRNKIFSTYGNVHSVSDLRCAIDELFFC